MGSFRRYRDIVLVVLLLAVPFFFLRTSISKPEELNPVDRTIMRLAAPVEYAAAALARGLSGIIADYAYLVDVKSDNNQLVYENARLKNQLRELNRSDAENKRLRRLLALRNTIPGETVSAVVIAKDTADYFRVVHVALDNPGAAIRSGMPVVGLDGAVGTVQRVAGDKVDVQLTIDSGFGVDVMVERTGARGFVRGTGDRARYSVRVEYVQRTDEVDVGDLLLTSGFGCRFPKGIPVARVSKVSRRDFGIYQAVEAGPTVDFSRLEEVLIVLSDSNECEQPDLSRTRRPKR
ncbi:MAG TPA: rod shape-determining protein MreC [Polyangiaceae bacterium]